MKNFSKQFQLSLPCLDITMYAQKPPVAKEQKIKATIARSVQLKIPFLFFSLFVASSLF